MIQWYVEEGGDRRLCLEGGDPGIGAQRAPSGVGEGIIQWYVKEVVIHMCGVGEGGSTGMTNLFFNRVKG